MAMVGASAMAGVIVETPAYRWCGDSVVQGEFVATAPGETEIISTYSAQPGYFMPIEKRWSLKNDISAYPRLKGSDRLHTAIYNMGLDEMVNAVEPDTTLRTGKEWAGVWTRDVSYSIILSMAWMQPEASMISLRKKVNAEGQIIQDTGSGGAWPVSSDRMIWAVAAWEVYKVTGDKDWLKFIYNVIGASLAKDAQVTLDSDGLVRGETSFIDWREQSYPRWMQTADIYTSKAMNTSVVHAAAYEVMSKIAAELGKKKESAEYAATAATIARAVNNRFWMSDKGYYAMYDYGRDYPIVNPRSETLGESLAILFDVASPAQALSITEHMPVTPFGASIFYPQISDIPSYHNNALWPFVASYWALANAKAGNEQGTLHAIGSVMRPAALFATNKENFVIDNGDIATELNSSNMLWSLAGNIGITQRILFGIGFEANGMTFKPFVPKALAAERTLENFRYRAATLNITVKGYGDSIASFTVNGKKSSPFIAADAKGVKNIVITMADNEIRPASVNLTANAKAPLTPLTRLSNSPALNGAGVPVNNLLSWTPIEYIAGYKVLRDGKLVAETRQTSYPATIPGEYQVIGVSAEGIESFASEPLSNAPSIVVEMPGEGVAMKSAEVSYAPATTVEGWNGNGFVEVDQTTAPINITVDVPAAGRYSVTARYANGNGPVNTENKCAVRSLSVDGQRVATLVMPQRGVANWNDWGVSNPMIVTLTPGTHTLTISMQPGDTNMNLKTNHAIIDSVTLTPLAD